MTAVTGDAVGTNTTGNYADNIKYRAFGSIKQIDYKLPDHTPQVKMEYDNRLRVSHFEAVSSNETSGFLMKADYNYFADSRTQSKDDLLDNKFDRTNKYDFAGRLVFNQWGMATNSEQQQVRVYQQTLQYDAFSMMTSRNGLQWDESIGFSETYQNGRIQAGQYSIINYSASGNVIKTGSTIDPHTFTDNYFDAAGRRVKYFSSTKGRAGSQLNMITEQQSENVFDGDGRPVKEIFGWNFYHYSDPQPTMTTAVKSYQVWSTVLKTSLTEVKPDGTKQETNIFAGRTVIAKQGASGASWKTADPVTGTVGTFGINGNGGTQEFEPLEQEVLKDEPIGIPEPPPNELVSRSEDMQWQCLLPREVQPMDCQIRAEIENSLNGTSIKSIYDPKKKPGDPNFVHEFDTPPEDVRGRASDRVTDAALHSTMKPQDTTQAGIQLEVTQIPSECDGDVDLENNIVNIRCGDSSLPEDIESRLLKDNKYSKYFTVGGYFTKSEIETFEKAQTDAQKLLKECGDKLKKEFEKRNLILDLDRLEDTIKSFNPKPKDADGKDSDYNVFYATGRTKFANTPEGKALKTQSQTSYVSSFVIVNTTGPLFINKGFMESINKNGGIDAYKSRAVVLIHEALHLIGWRHPYKDGKETIFKDSADFTQVILDACVPGFKRSDLSIDAH